LEETLFPIMSINTREELEEEKKIILLWPSPQTKAMAMRDILLALLESSKMNLLVIDELPRSVS